MAENRFARMLQTAKERVDAPPEEMDPPQETAIAREPKPRKAVSQSKVRGRPATGKRSDPDYESTTVFLRRDTKTAAARLLLDDREQDLSDVLEKLLSSWVRKNS